MQNRSKIGLLVAALVFLLGVGGILIGRQKAVPPETLIRQSLNEVEAAAKRGDTNGVMKIVSEDFRAGMFTKKALSLRLLQAFRNGRGVDYDVHVNQPQILASPKGKTNERLVISQFAVLYAATGDDIYNTTPVTLVMREEFKRKWLFFKEPVWRVVSVVGVMPLPDESLTGE